ncbi:hypothetical protein [Proteiniclasticum sp. QWL-01]|uniref:hypothetical protein n=1 Tax=Proteiniclasticum sp. QWL-01 TaxID=3036945 RepID=UPI0024118A9B|nr:hypothetical protein [Proteiniclasticum sp. QWL-01]WFF73681.1 hypothetical protein P6M73_04335 [Proteiniclasticum sp. QWL-01]
MLEKILFGLLGIGLAYKFKENRDDKARMRIPCSFTKDITKLEFEDAVRKSAIGIKRLKNIEIDGPLVYGTVKSQSGLHLWNFKLDFNDYGIVSGNYWIYSENSDSEIPQILAKRIQDEIYSR